MSSSKSNSRSNALPTVSVAGALLVVRMPTGLEIRFPIAGNPRLAQGDEQTLQNIEVSPFGIHWPDLDEDLSFAGLAKGDYGQKACHL